MRLLLKWLLTAVALLVVAHIVPGFEVGGFGAALIAALVIGLINATIGALLKIITFPITCLTVGIFLLVINALMLMLASRLLDGFEVRGFFPALIGAIVLALLNVLIRRVTKDKDDN